MRIDALRGGFSISGVIVTILSSLAVIFFTLPIHEFAHGFVASKLGDPTPRYQGRLTLNPFAHIDYLGALCILLVGFGWAKPVQINARYFKNPKMGMALSALAGPVSNLLVALIALFICNLLDFLVVASELVVFVYRVFCLIAQINIYLAVFNLLPVPPLDGSRVLFVFLPQKYYFSVMRYERYISIAVIILLFTDVLSRPLSALSGYIFYLENEITALPFSLF